MDRIDARGLKLEVRGSRFEVCGLRRIFETTGCRKPLIANHKPKSGFTFIELLVVVALFSLISVSMFSSFSLGMKVWRKAASPNVSHRKSLLALGRLSIELRQTFDYPPIGFFGEKDSISFANIAGDRIYNISYTYKASEGGFYRQSHSLQEIKGFENETRARKIVSSVKDAAFSFYGFDGKKGHADFFDTWNYTISGVPEAIKVSLELEDGEAFEKIIFIPAGQ